MAPNGSRQLLTEEQLLATWEKKSYSVIQPTSSQASADLEISPTYADGINTAQREGRRDDGHGKTEDRC